MGLAACQGTPEYANRAEAILAQIHNPKSDYVVVVCYRGDWRNFPENSALAELKQLKLKRAHGVATDCCSKRLMT